MLRTNRKGAHYFTQAVNDLDPPGNRRTLADRCTSSRNGDRARRDGDRCASLGALDSPLQNGQSERVSDAESGVTLPVVLRGSRARALRLLMISAVFVAAGVLIAIDNHEGLGWLVVAFFGLCLIVAVAQWIRPPTLVITAAAFQVRSLGRTWSRDLASCGEFSVSRNPVANQSMVVFDHPIDAPKKAAKASRAMSGHTGALPDTFGMNANDLAKLLNQTRKIARVSESGAGSTPDDRS